MKQSSTLFLRTVVLLLGLIVLGLCLFVLPAGIGAEDAGGYRPILLGMYLPAIPFFIALFYAMKLLDYIDKAQAFSYQAVVALRRIKYNAIVISGLYAIGMPYIFWVAERDDAPGVVLIALVFTFGPLVIAVGAAVLQKLLQDALNMKSENELTV